MALRPTRTTRYVFPSSLARTDVRLTDALVSPLDGPDWSVCPRSLSDGINTDALTPETVISLNNQGRSTLPTTSLSSLTRPDLIQGFNSV